MAELSRHSSEAQRQCEELSSELKAQRELQEHASCRLNVESAARVELEGERDRLAAEVAVLQTASDKFHFVLKRLVLALEENENLVQALSEDLRQRSPARPGSAVNPQIEVQEQPEPSGRFLGRLVGRKRK